MARRVALLVLVMAVAGCEDQPTTSPNRPNNFASAPTRHRGPNEPPPKPGPVDPCFVVPPIIKSFDGEVVAKEPDRFWVRGLSGRHYLLIPTHHLPEGTQSTWATGILEIDTGTGSGPGKVNLDGGKLSYTGGQIDTINNDAGYIYVYNSATLRLTADPGQIGAKLFIGRDWLNAVTPGTLELNTPGNMTFYKDATIGIAMTGIANLNQGGIKLFNMGGSGGQTGTGWFENYGTTTVNNTIPSDMYFYNVAGTVTIASDKMLDIAGSKTLADNTKTSYYNAGGTTILKPGATLKLVQRYYQSGGELRCDDTGVAAPIFTVNGNVDIDAGVLQMGTAENTFGSLNITGSLRFGATSTLNIHVSGTEDKNDKITAQSVSLVNGCTLGARFTGQTGAFVNAEREFLVVADGLTGTWTNTIFTGDSVGWGVGGNQKKLTHPPAPPKG
jgi:hypothetical protein